MLMSNLLGKCTKEKPAESFMLSHTFLIRGGYIKPVSNGIYSLMPPAKKISMKIENIIREKMDDIDGQEVLFPVVLPAELWDESGRYESVGSELLRFTDRTGRKMLLAMTHEEAAVHMAKNVAESYTQYPFMIYQIQTKFRDEPRARAGLIRVREFTMKDAYSFHTTQEDLEEYYLRVLQAYNEIFKKVGLENVVSIKSDTGMMGGQTAHEFMYLSEHGEDTLVICDHCGYKSNMEVAKSEIEHNTDQESEIKEIYTKDIKDIESLAKSLSIKENKFIKCVVFLIEETNKPLIVFIRGDKQVNEAKLKKIVMSNILPFTDYKNLNLSFGFIGPYGLNVGSDVKVVYDISLENENNMVCGANKYDYHYSGVCVDRDIKPEKYYDISKVNEGECCPECKNKLILSRGIEIGNIFQLGKKYTESMNMTYVDKDGLLKTPIMGCYGIGVGRLLACIIEENHDDKGPIWPKSVAPWLVHICVLNNEREDIMQLGRKLYSKLNNQYSVILDDRHLSAGVQFADADLLGVPVRVIISKRNLENNEVEIVSRDKSICKKVKIEDVEEQIKEVLDMVK